MKLRFTLKFSLLFLFPVLAFSQNPVILLQYNNPDSLFVCGSDTLTITVLNNGTDLAPGATLQLNLPSGIFYAPGTVSGASESNIGNLLQPRFTLPAVAANGQRKIGLQLMADCEAGDLLNAGGFFVATISVTGPGVNVSISTISIPLFSGLLLFDHVEDLLMQGEKGDTLYRKICVKNTRFGKIGSLFFEDAHESDITVNVLQAETEQHAGNLYTATFDPGIFSSSGNGDGWLDFGESVCFTERIIINDCGIPEHFTPSQLRIGWGCNGDVCQLDTIPASILIKTSTRIPKLVIIPGWAPPVDHCANTAAQMALHIRNEGRADAVNVSVTLQMADLSGFAAMDPASFRLVRPDGTIIPVTPNFSVSILLADCQKPASTKLTLAIPLVPAMDSVRLEFGVLTCIDPCEQLLPVINVEYFYTKPCPPNGFVSEALTINPDPQSVVKSWLNLNVGACLLHGETYSAVYHVKSNRLTKSNGFLNLSLELPHGITLDQACDPLTLGGVSPAQIQSTPANNGATQLLLQFPLPFLADSAELKLCLHYECDSSLYCVSPPVTQKNISISYAVNCTPCFLSLKVHSYWSPQLATPEACGIGDCQEYFLAVAPTCAPIVLPPFGDTSDVTNLIPPGYHWKMSVERTNFGFKDSTDDRTADDGSRAKADQIRLDRYLAGDTSCIAYCGYVDSGTVTIIPRLIWHEITVSDLDPAFGNDGFDPEVARLYFTDANKLRYLSDSLRIRYADGAQVAFPIDSLLSVTDKNLFILYAPNVYPPKAVDLIVSQRHFFRISLPDMFSAGLIPRPTLSMGDSIFFTMKFKLDLNYNYTVPGQSDPPLIGFRTAMDHWGSKFAGNAHPFKRMQYSGFIKTLGNNTFSIRPCEQSVEAKSFRYSIRIARENLFPFEVRPLATIFDYHQSLPPAAGLHLNSAKLKYLALQDSTNRLSNIDLPFGQTANDLNINFSPAFATLIDEGFMLGTRFTFDGNCAFARPDSSIQQVTTRFEDCINGQNQFETNNLRNPIGFFENHPELLLLTPDSVVISPTRPFDFDFILKNPVVSPALFPWVSVQSLSGLASDFRLLAMPENLPVASTNGIFNLPKITGGTGEDFRITGQNVSCEPDSLLVIFGWGCAPMSNIDQNGCFRDTFVVLLNLQSPELELDISPEPDSLWLCDTSEYFEFKIFNANNGYTYDLFADVQLPDGMQVAPSTSQIFYEPAGNWTDIHDPALLQGNVYQWDVGAEQPLIGANGLPGEDLPHENYILIRFKVITECGLVSNSQIIYGTYGKDACERPANTLNRLGKRIPVAGLPPFQDVQLDLAPLPNTAAVCGGTQVFNVQLTLFNTPSPDDSLIIRFPAGVTYVNNSYIPGVNAVPGPPTENPGLIRVALPQLPGGGIVQFSFTVAYSPESGCTPGSIQAQTRVRSEAFCPTIGAPCDVYVSTGEAVVPLQVQHNQLALGAIASVNPGGGFQIPVINTGTTVASGINAGIYFDLDQNEGWSAADTLMLALHSTQIIQPGESILLSGGLNIDPDLLCRLLFVLDPEENCLCEPVVLVLHHFDMEHQDLIFCNSDPVIVGVTETSGYDYLWQTDSGLNCLTCSETQYTPDPDLPPGSNVSLILEETAAGGCAITHHFNLSFGLTASLTVDQPAICRGETIVLQVEPPGGSYQWTGPGVGQLSGSTATLTPDTTSTYQVEVTLPNGCIDSASITVAVYPGQVMTLPLIQACAGTKILVFGDSIVAVTGVYQKDTLNVFGCDSLILQPVVVVPNTITDETVAFCEGETVLLFGDTPVSTATQVCRHFAGSNGCDSLHCIQTVVNPRPELPAQDTIFAQYAEAIVLGPFPGYAHYNWEPEPQPPCVDCPSIEVTPDSSGYQEYVLTVSDANGCSDTVLYRVVVFPPCDIDKVAIPNAFTPNNDGSNDVFRPIPSEGGETFGKLTIYDRWGEKVYESTTELSWDGTVKGKPGASDVYVYIIEVICGNLVKPRSGGITLLR